MSGAAPTTRGPSGALVALARVVVLTTLAAVPAIGPETWSALAGGGPLAALARAGGPAALGALHALALVVVAVLVQAGLDLDDPLRRLATVVVAVAPCAVVPVGPRLLGLVLAALALVLWGRLTDGPTPGRGPGLAAALVALTAGWALLDPGWLLAPLLGAVALAVRRPGPGRSGRWPVATLVAVAAAGALVTTARLAGATSWTAALGAQATALWSGPVAGGSGPRPLTDPLVLVVVLPVLLVVGAWLRGHGRPTRADAGGAALALLLAVGPAGTAPAAGLVAAPVLAAALRRGDRSPGPRAVRGARRVAPDRLLALVLVLGLPLAAVTTARAAAADPVLGLYPALRALPAGTRVLADPRVGPRAAVGAGVDLAAVPDGRLLAALRAEPAWRGVVTGSGARAALLTDDAPLLAALQERLGWEVTARSGPLVLCRAPSSGARPSAAGADATGG